MASAENEVSARLGAVECSLGSVSAAIDRLELQVCRIGDALQSVSRPDCTPITAKGESPSYACPLADRIQSLASRVNEAADYLSAAYERVEL